MSRFTGRPGDLWPLGEMTHELAAAARRAARPGWIWVAGLLYPSIALAPLGTASWLSSDPLDGAESLAHLAVIWPLAVAVALPLFILLSRLNAGLARLAPPTVWDRVSGDRGRPELKDCWKAGRGLTASVLGLRLSVDLLRYAVLLLMLVPAGFAWGVLESVSMQGPGEIALAIFALPALAVLLIYNLLLSLLMQLALHSLVHNRRGVASALQHAWSMLRRAPWAGARALTGEVILALTALLIEAAVMLLTMGTLTPFGFFAVPLALALQIALVCLAGIIGVTRAIYWAKAYRALGGLSPDDGVPGLEDADVVRSDA